MNIGGTSTMTGANGGAYFNKSDFEPIYKLYPRRLGKSTGISRLCKTIRTQSAFDNFRSAVINYAEYCKIHQLEEKYIMHFSTFANKRWLDFVDREDCGLSPASTGPALLVR